jgi:hypothetical protein
MHEDEAITEDLLPAFGNNKLRARFGGRSWLASPLKSNAAMCTCTR